MISGLLTNIADNVSNFVQCVADQGVGAIMNTIIGGVTKALQPLLGGVGKILGGFNPFSFLTSAVDAFQNVVSALDCNEPPADYALASNEWTIGVGTNEGSGTPVSQILETANKAREAASRGFGIVDAVQDIAGLTGSLGVFDFANPSVSTPGFESVLETATQDHQNLVDVVELKSRSLVVKELVELRMQSLVSPTQTVE